MEPTNLVRKLLDAAANPAGNLDEEREAAELVSAQNMRSISAKFAALLEERLNEAGGDPIKAAGISAAMLKSLTDGTPFWASTAEPVTPVATLSSGNPTPTNTPSKAEELGNKLLHITKGSTPLAEEALSLLDLIAGKGPRFAALVTGLGGHLTEENLTKTGPRLSTLVIRVVRAVMDGDSITHDGELRSTVDARGLEGAYTQAFTALRAAAHGGVTMPSGPVTAMRDDAINAIDRISTERNGASALLTAVAAKLGITRGAAMNDDALTGGINAVLGNILTGQQLIAALAKRNAFPNDPALKKNVAGGQTDFTEFDDLADPARALLYRANLAGRPREDGKPGAYRDIDLNA
jgi:hypothetical protein